MVILGLLLIVIGALAILAALFVSDGSGHILGIAVTTPTIFIAGVVAGVLILWGYTILKYGTKRGLRQRKERKQLSELSEKLDRVEADREQREES